MAIVKVDPFREFAAMQDRMIERGYVVVYINYRNEIPHLYETSDSAVNLPDDLSGGDNRTLKSAPSLDSDDFISIVNYVRTLPYADPKRHCGRRTHGRARPRRGHHQPGQDALPRWRTRPGDSHQWLGAEHFHDRP